MIDERQLREMLERRAETISATPTDEPKAIRRARRRLARNATVAGLVGLVVVAGALTGLRTIRATPPPVEPATSSPPSPAKLGSLAYPLDGDIYVAESDGSNAVRIADGRPASECGDWPGGGEYWAEGPLWSPDGRYLAYRHRNCDRPEGARGGSVVVSDSEGNVVAEFPGEGWGISWSPESARVAVWVDLGEGTIGVFGLDGERQALLTVPPEVREAGDFDPVWLPDGDSVRVRDVVLPIDGSSPYVDPSASDGRGEVASPDGSLVAFTSRKPGSAAENQLRVREVATETVTLLVEANGSDTETEQFSVIDFSPDGDRILFSRIDVIHDNPSDPGSYRSLGIGSLWSVNADGSDLRRLVSGTVWGDWLSLSATP